MKLDVRLFKEEEIDGVYRAHFIVYYNGTEITRFALEFSERPSESVIIQKQSEILEQIKQSPPLKMKKLIEATRRTE